MYSKERLASEIGIHEQTLNEWLKVFNKPLYSRLFNERKLTFENLYSIMISLSKWSTTRHNIIVKGGLVKVVENYITKGKEIAVEGKLTNRSWEDKDGKKHYTTEILCNELLMLSK